MTEVASTHERVVAAALRCLARHGLHGTTVDEVASDAGVSRATLYRAFPGGATRSSPRSSTPRPTRLFGAIAAAHARTPSDLEDALVAGLVAAARWLTGHDVLERLMFDEPATVLTHLEFEQMDRTLAAAAQGAAPLLLERFVGPQLAPRVGEWATRIASRTCCSPPTRWTCASGASTRWLVRRYVAPGLAAAATEVREDETLSAKLS